MPAFFLALAPNSDRVRLGFIGRVLRVAVPGGLLVSIGTFVAYLIARHTDGLSLEQERTTATLVLAASAVLVLVRVARPLVAWKIGLIVAMAAFLGLTMMLDAAARLLRARRPAARDADHDGASSSPSTALLLPVVWKVVRPDDRLGRGAPARAADDEECRPPPDRCDVTYS